MSDRRTPRTCFSHLAHPGSTWRWALITGWTFWSSPCTSCSCCWSDFGYVLYNIQWMGVAVLCLQLYVIANTTVNVCRHSYDFLFCWPQIKSAYGKTSNIIIFFLYSVVLLFFYTYFLQSMCRKERNTTKGYFLAGRSMTWFPVSFLDKSCISYCSHTVLFPSTFLLVDNTKWPLCLQLVSIFI